MANYSITFTLTHPHTAQTGYSGGEWEMGRGGVELGGGVVSRCRNVFLDLSDISEGGERFHLVSLPLWPPPSRAASQHSLPKSKYVGGSSNKIYRWGHKTPCMRGGRETWCSRTQSWAAARIRLIPDVLVPAGGFISVLPALWKTHTKALFVMLACYLHLIQYSCGRGECYSHWQFDWRWNPAKSYPGHRDLSSRGTDLHL